MCGIVGMVGDFEVGELIQNLKKLEYRGYDSAGIAYLLNNNLMVHKVSGKVDRLRELMRDELTKKISEGIAHTRWATHGEPNDINAHPHMDCEKKIAVVHNGIIENYKELKEELLRKGHRFVSETDTEVIAHLIEEEFHGDLLEAVRRAVLRLRGAYAIAVIHKEIPRVIVAARRGSPLVIGKSEGLSLLASDVTPLLKYTRNVVFLEDGDVALLKPEDVKIYYIDGTKPSRNFVRISWSEKDAEKSGYKHFMYKEIMEEPQAIVSALAGRIKKGKVFLEELETLNIEDIHRIDLVSCGTSFYASMIFKYFLENHSDMVVNLEVSSEYRYKRPHVDEHAILIAVSQSGETADTLESVRLAKRFGARVLSVVNVVGSTLDRESDVSIYMNAGPEIGVAATKTYVAELVTLYLIALKFIERKEGWRSYYSDMLDRLLRIPEIYENILRKAEELRKISEKYMNYKHFMYIGRGYGYPTALEGALKLKEITYIHATAYPAGELKHGPIALLDRNFPVFAMIPSDSLYYKMKNNVVEARSRNARIIALGTEGNKELKEIGDDVITVPSVPEPLYPLLMAPIIQMFAYFISDMKGLDPDKPRNLAKSVTVE